ncbi:MAG: type II toxin-antitoxin system RelB/DinJ family antitoxin [Oscillospiraceae bacterium]|nr:type II toxin-antitoxin system RelB/DinJ family antitoxin [Oscillospiraceae bacterium]
MPKNTTINLRVNSAIKEETKQILSSMGLTFSEAFNMMLHQIKIHRALPFDVISYSHIPKPETAALIERIETGEEKLYRFNSVEELLADLHAEDDDE